MSNTEAIYLLGSLLEVVTEEKTEDFDEAIRKAIEALGKQIPKKPIDLYFDKRCPSCESLWGVKKGQEFCDKCGQALDWSNE